MRHAPSLPPPSRSVLPAPHGHASPPSPLSPVAAHAVSPATVSASSVQRRVTLTPPPLPILSTLPVPPSVCGPAPGGQSRGAHGTANSAQVNH
ncbi:hypothetical protein ACOMHN_051811 [Nucella lapillus]